MTKGVEFVFRGQHWLRLGISFAAIHGHPCAKSGITGVIVYEVEADGLEDESRISG